MPCLNFSYVLTFYLFITNFNLVFQVEVATKNDVVGVEDSKLRDILKFKTELNSLLFDYFSRFFSSKLTKSAAKGSVFALGSRGTLIENPEDPPIDATITASSSNTAKYTYDELFRSMLKLLVDQVNCEFFFVRDFFLSDDDVTFGIFPRCSDMLFVCYFKSYQIISSSYLILFNRKVSKVTQPIAMMPWDYW